jgi:hypothetical protein
MNRFFSIILLFLLFSTFSSDLFAQSENVEIRKDTLVDAEGGVIITDLDEKGIDTFKSKSKSDPRRATLYSAVLPGLGQAYNNKYWKIPILYGGFVALAYGIDWQHDRYILLRRELVKLQEGKPRDFPNLNEASLRSNIDKFRRDRDYLIVITGVAYALNIIDAHVDAQLKEFDVNEDISMKIGPSFKATDFATLQAGLSVKLYFK